MTEPLVACVMLTADRQALSEKALACFEAQTYRNKWLLVLDTGVEPFRMEREFGRAVTLARSPERRGLTIGALRNTAVELASSAQIIVHWDSDDWSHPNRMAEQVALLQASGADAVGYNEMLFARGPMVEAIEGEPQGGYRTFAPGRVIPETEAWLYRNHRPNYVLGTSLCYWRKTWERERFADGPAKRGATSEYHHWFTSLKIATDNAHGFACVPPMMIARIHSANFSDYDIERQRAEGSKEWARVPEWDARVRELLC